MIFAAIALFVVFLPACTGGHYFDITPTPVPPTPTLIPTATAIPPTATLQPTPTRTPLIIPSPQRQPAVPGASASSPAAWQESGSLLEPRGGHTATLLADGSVLAVGGFGESDASTEYSFGTLASAERYDPLAKSWRAAEAMGDARAYHTATLLPNGLVLVVGGEDDERYLATAELYDPATSRWQATGALTTPRSDHTATSLPDGSVLVIGGFTSPDGLLPGRGQEYGYTATAERYDPATGTWLPAGNLLAERAGHSATLLPGGEILIVGGVSSEYDEDEEFATSERFDPTTGTSRPAANLPAAHYEHTATTLPGGRVLVIGDAVRQAQVYEPDTDRWQPAGRVGSERYGFTSTLLPSGLLLIFGGAYGDEAAELFMPQAGLASPAAQPRTQRIDHTATLLADGSVLIVGGYDYDDESYLQTTERYVPALDQGIAARQPGEYRANFTTWPQFVAGEVVRYAADPTGTSYEIRLAPSFGYSMLAQPERTSYSDFVAEVVIHQGDSTEVSAGIVFRSQAPPNLRDEAYVAYILNSGEFGIARIDKAGRWHYVQPAVQSSTIRPYGTNRLRVTCDGESITIAINDQAVGRYHASLTDAGQIGLFIESWGDEPLDVVFSQLRIIPLP